MSGTRPIALARSITSAISVVGRAGREIEPFDAEAAEDAADQGLGRGIERPGMDDDVAGLDEGEQQGRDRRHAARRR